MIECNFGFLQGYASLAQTDTGLHMRQRSRAFIVGDASSPSNRIVFINAGKFLTIPVAGCR
jgi:hypothetical protein